MWLAVLNSGVHPTVAGVLLALTIPSRKRIDGRPFLARSDKLLAEFRNAEEAGPTLDAGERKNAVLHALAQDCREVESPMLRFEHALVPWVTYVIVPVFALANAGVAFGAERTSSLTSPVGLGIIAGLALGKPIGIVAFSWLVTRAGLAALPDGVSWRQILGVGALGGIGFTMSLFVADLAFGATEILEVAKIGILGGSFVSAAAGLLILSVGSVKNREALYVSRLAL